MWETTKAILLSHEVPAFIRGWIESGCFLTEGCIGLLAFSASVDKVRQVTVALALKRLTNMREAIRAFSIGSMDDNNAGVSAIVTLNKSKAEKAIKDYEASIEEVLSAGTTSCWKWTIWAVIILSFGLYQVMGPFVLHVLKPIYTMHKKAKALEDKATLCMNQITEYLGECQQVIEQINRENTKEEHGEPASTSIAQAESS